MKNYIEWIAYKPEFEVFYENNLLSKRLAELKIKLGEEMAYKLEIAMLMQIPTPKLKQLQKEIEAELTRRGEVK